MAIDPARETAAMSAIRSLGIYPKKLPDGSWQAIQTRNGRSGEAVETTRYPDPVEAIEGAQAALLTADTRDKLQRLSRLYDGLSRGVYVPWPKIRPTGEIDFQVVRATDRVVMSTHNGLLQALVEISRLVNEPIPTNGV